MEKIELEIVALSSGSGSTHYYAVVLGEVNGIRRLPIVIGTFEAQAIVVALEKMKPTRPLTHDLFFNFLLAFGIELKEVLIHKLEEGIFYARLYCQQGTKTLEIDSRTSDALALAIRIGCPIYTYESILKTAGLMLDPSTTIHQPPVAPEAKSTPPPPPHFVSSDTAAIDDLRRKSLEELHRLLNEVLEKEEYMKAVTIRDEIQRRKNNPEDISSIDMS